MPVCSRVPWFVAALALAAFAQQPQPTVVDHLVGFDQPIPMAPHEVRTFFIRDFARGIDWFFGQPPVGGSEGVTVIFAGLAPGVNIPGRKISIRQLPESHPIARGRGQVAAITIQGPPPLYLPDEKGWLFRPRPHLIFCEESSASEACRFGVPATDGLELRQVASNIHVLNTCDPVLTLEPEPPCRPVITHADGRLVTEDNPAGEREVLVAWATGLGRGREFVETPASKPVPVDDTVVDFTHRANQRPTAPNPLEAEPPIYAGFVQGAVGLYQINFRLPSLAAAIPGCENRGVESNLTVNIGRMVNGRVDSFDGAGLCVE